MIKQTTVMCPRCGVEASLRCNVRSPAINQYTGRIQIICPSCAVETAAYSYTLNRPVAVKDIEFEFKYAAERCRECPSYIKCLTVTLSK